LRYEAEHPITELEILNALTYCPYQTRQLIARCERQLGPKLVFVLNDQDIREIDSCGHDIHQYLARVRLWLG
jgi:hypothetical protein